MLEQTKKLELARTWQLANYTQPLFETDYVFTAEVIPYQKQWKGSLKQKARIVTGLLSQASLLTRLWILAPGLQEPHLSKTPGFFAMILHVSNATKTLFSNVSECLQSGLVLLLLSYCARQLSHTIHTTCTALYHSSGSCHQPGFALQCSSDHCT